MKELYIIGFFDKNKLSKDDIPYGVTISFEALVADTPEKLLEFLETEYDAIILDPIRQFNDYPVYFLIKNGRVEICSYSTCDYVEQ